MNNDLISRSALKKAVFAEFGNSNLTDAFNELIDNAPAVSLVEPVCKIKVNITEEEKQKLIEELQKPHKPLILPEPEIAFERPQGEWIFQKANEEQTDGYECSNCKACFHTKVPYFSEFNFCPNCGADMKGGAE